MICLSLKTLRETKTQIWSVLLYVAEQKKLCISLNKQHVDITIKHISSRHCSIELEAYQIMTQHFYEF